MTCRGMPCHTNRPLNPLSASTAIPPLHVRMFGGDGNTRGGRGVRSLFTYSLLHDQACIAFCITWDRGVQHSAAPDRESPQVKAIVESYEIDSRL